LKLSGLRFAFYAPHCHTLPDSKINGMRKARLDSSVRYMH
jgi:hypothetical protein